MDSLWEKNAKCIVQQQQQQTERKNAEDGKLHTRKQMTALKKAPKSLNITQQWDLKHEDKCLETS